MTKEGKKEKKHKKDKSHKKNKKHRNKPTGVFDEPRAPSGEGSKNIFGEDRDS